jgi:hypothetical protein
MIALQVPRELLFQKIFEAARGLLRVVFLGTLDSCDCVIWLALAVRTRVVVVVVTPLIPGAVVAAARVVLALAANASYLVFALSSSSAHEVIMSLSLVMELGWQRPKSSKVRWW